MINVFMLDIYFETFFNRNKNLAATFVSYKKKKINYNSVFFIMYPTISSSDSLIFL